MRIPSRSLLSSSENSMTLRSKLIRLAYAQPDLRSDLLPILKEGGWGNRFTIPRNSYLPKNQPTLRKVKAPEGLEVWIWEEGESKTPYGAAWAGKADKPLWHYRFRNEDQRQRQIDEQIRSYELQVEAKRKRMEDRKNFEHGLKVGDILYSSWGYDQTNVDWYEVTKVIGKQVEIREIAGKTVEEGRGSDKVVALPGKFVGPPMRKTPSGGSYGDRKYISVKIDSSQIAHLWDGTPKHQTSFGFGH